MAENNKTYRIRTKVGREADTYLNVKLDQEYDTLEILSLKLRDKDTYKLHNADYGVVAGRVLANGNFGVPNAKISVFIEADRNAPEEIWDLYPYTSTSTKDKDGIRYNLLPDEPVKDCHKNVGTFPNKTYMLDNDALIEVFDTYYKYTTRTNASGDYIICGLPTGMQTIHMDLDLSDCGILSQRPRDFVYKGYTIEQFENPNQFKKDENLDSLSQIFSQNLSVYVQPFWGNEDNGEEIGITRADIEISFKFEPTCVFLGSAVSDAASNGIGKKCVPTDHMGSMDELTAGEGTIEMIRKTPGGNVEEFSVKGNQLIDGNGVWCYQIPMNLDYMMTDEYGNMVPTDDPEKGIPTRTRVRFRASLTDMDGDIKSFYRAKYLIPNNPTPDDTEVDYNFGTYTKESSYRDLFWNGVYTVKSYIPRFQKSQRWRSERFTGIKACNYYGNNNPMPYNNLRIKIPFMFTVLCVFVKLFMKIVSLVNRFQGVFLIWRTANNIRNKKIHCVFIGDGLCPDMEGWYFAPNCGNALNHRQNKWRALLNNTIAAATGTGTLIPGSDDGDDEASNDPVSSTDFTDETSIDAQNISASESNSVCLTFDVDYLLNCFEMNLAQEYRVIKFDFYNDWVNGVLYFPRWLRQVRRKKRYKFSLSNGLKAYYVDKVKGCMNSENSTAKKTRYYVQQCSLSYSGKTNEPWTGVTTDIYCYSDQKLASSSLRIIPSRCHKKQGMHLSPIFGPNFGLVNEETTMLGQNVYYLKPCEWGNPGTGRQRTLLFATDIILLGSLNDCDENGIPQAFKYLSNTSYIMPTNLALTTMDDESYIYSNNKGSVCSSNKMANDSSSNLEEQALEIQRQYESGEITEAEYVARINEIIGLGNPVNPPTQEQESVNESVLRTTPDFQSTYNAYRDTDGDQIEYKYSDDPIAITEAAGISWNYSGPGQDRVESGKAETPKELLKRLFDKNYTGAVRLYNPGGHFLGLSCTNSQTNIKSCELGATMSQRREEINSYDQSGNPQYSYYVPTGLISNVDVPGAEFRTMFATLNHNKLIATKMNPETGYRQYDFSFLRPDGFDGSLRNYVHVKGSPYNEYVNSGATETYPDSLRDESDIIRGFFPSWTEPLDYDPNEVENTARRTVEDTVWDYYMFRFGLNTLSDSEQRKHYLKHNGKMHALPQYENSFYFYFGLKDGATALDEFKKQFFSQCESNVIKTTPYLSTWENLEPGQDYSVADVLLNINNMVADYSIIIKDEASGQKTLPYTETKSDNISVKDILRVNNMNLVFGRSYTITVEDSIGQVATTTFTFAADAVKIDARAINFRRNLNNLSEDRYPRDGGYFKVNDTFTILGQEASISAMTSAGTIEVRVSIDVTGQEIEDSNYNYKDADDTLWHVYPLPKPDWPQDGISATVIMKVKPVSSIPFSAATAVFEDNRNIQLNVDCEYLTYGKLSGKTTSDWLNNRNIFSGKTWERWLYRHSYYRQKQDDAQSYNHYIYTNNDNELAIFGQPERGGLTASGQLSPSFVYKGDYDSYSAYSLEEAYSYIPTMYWSSGHGETTSTTQYRKMFCAMAHSEDGRAAANAEPVTITSYTYNDGVITLGYTGTPTTRLSAGTGCIVVFEDGTKIFPIVKPNNTLTAKTDDVYPGITGDQLKGLLRYATVYPTLPVPYIYKPFYAAVSAATWCIPTLVLGTNAGGITVPQRKDCYPSYKIEGKIHNGLTFDNHFNSGKTANDEYRTYLLNPASSEFVDTVTAQTQYDYQQRDIVFGKMTSIRQGDFFREFTTLDDTGNSLTAVSYAITENAPTLSESANAFTGRYQNGFDLHTISDSQEILTLFLNDLNLRTFNSGQSTSGECILYTSTETPNPDVKLYVTNEEVFVSATPLTIQSAGKNYCYGFYNENAKYDEKGGTTTVTKLDNDLYEFAITQETGTKIRLTGNETGMSVSGVSVLHGFTIKDQYTKNMEQIYGLSWQEISAYTPQTIQSAETFSGSTMKTLRATYEHQIPGSKNKMVISRLYNIGSLPIMYAPAEEGENPRLEIVSDTAKTIYCTSSEQTVMIPVNTNVYFNVSIDDGEGWTEGGGVTYGPATTSFPVAVKAFNPETTGQSRSCTITVTRHNDGGRDTGLTDSVTLTQTVDATLISLQNQMTEISGQVDDLQNNQTPPTPPDDNGGTDGEGDTDNNG